MVFFFLLLFSLFKRFEDLMNNVPLPEYTRRDGSRNLVSRYIQLLCTSVLFNFTWTVTLQWVIIVVCLKWERFRLGANWAASIPAKLHPLAENSLLSQCLSGEGFLKEGGGGVTQCRTEGTNQIVISTSMPYFTKCVKKSSQRGWGGGEQGQPSPPNYALDPSSIN